MSQYERSPSQANLTLSNKQGLVDILDKVDIAVNNIYARRTKTTAYFKEELFIAKNKHEFFAQWALDEKDHLVITPKTIDPNQNQGALGNLMLQHNTGKHHKDEYNNLIRYAFKSAVANLKNTERALKMAIRYQGSVEISADILNNMDFFSNNAECVQKLDNYCKRSVDKFIKNNTPNPQAVIA